MRNFYHRWAEVDQSTYDDQVRVLLDPVVRPRPAFDAAARSRS